MSKSTTISSSSASSEQYADVFIADSNHDQKVIRILKKVGLENSIKIHDTLQGNIWRATNISNETYQKQTQSVIKVTNQYLHQHSIAIINNKSYKVYENIVSEQYILKYLTQNEKCPKSIVKYQQFFKTNSDYFLVMEDGGMSLFRFIKNAHQLIQSGKIEISHWIKVVKVIFKQMIECIDYIHSMNVCHFDISLENFLINDVPITVHGNGPITFFINSIQIKLCDFGLAQIFKTDECLSNIYCGKQNYKSPEVINKTIQFDGKKNDIWALGVCLFMMIIGNPPFIKANESDQIFGYIMNGYIWDVIKGWNRLKYVDTNLMHLFQSIFQYESDRINLNDIKQHLWIK